LVEYRRHDQLDMRLLQMRIAVGEVRDELGSGQRRLLFSDRALHAAEG
jgi:hypothetical protein